MREGARWLDVAIELATYIPVVHVKYSHTYTSLPSSQCSLPLTSLVFSFSTLLAPVPILLWSAIDELIMFSGELSKNVRARRAFDSGIGEVINPCVSKIRDELANKVVVRRNSIFEVLMWWDCKIVWRRSTFEGKWVESRKAAPALCSRSPECSLNFHNESLRISITQAVTRVFHSDWKN